MALNRTIIAIICLMVGFVASADVNRYIIYFPDKKDNAFSVDRPSEFLSQKAIDRRTKLGFQITEQDLPVNANYLDSLVKYGIEPVYTSKWFNAALVQEDESALQNISNKSFVSSWELVAPGTAYAESPSERNMDYTANNPPAFNISTNTQLDMLSASDMHEDGFTGDGVWIAVFDSGFEGVNESAVYSNLFNDNRIIDTEDFLTGGKDVYVHDDHGSRVLSCIAANYQNSVVGTGHGADISLYITESTFSGDDEYRIEEFNWTIAAEKADSSGVDIITSSVGYINFTISSMDYSLNDLDGETAVITKAANYASERGILVVNSAGNTGSSSVWNKVVFPADAESVLAVGGVTESLVRSSFSALGPTADNRVKPDLVAMATSVVVVNKNGEVITSNGTSFSCPLIAGFAASLWQSRPELTNGQLRDLILTSGSQANNPDNSLGHGIPSYLRALDIVLTIPEVDDDDIVVYPNPVVNDQINIKLQNLRLNTSLLFELYNSEGQLVVAENRKIANLNSVEKMSLTGFPSGIYILSISGMDKYRAIKLRKH